jgi:hypothetical protein
MKEYIGRDVKAWKAGSWKWHVACLAAIVLGFGLLAVGLQIPGVVTLLVGTVLVWVSLHVHGKLGGNEEGHWYT